MTSSSKPLFILNPRLKLYLAKHAYMNAGEHLVLEPQRSLFLRQSCFLKKTLVWPFGAPSVCVEWQRSSLSRRMNYWYPRLCRWCGMGSHSPWKLMHPYLRCLGFALNNELGEVLPGQFPADVPSQKAVVSHRHWEGLEAKCGGVSPHILTFIPIQPLWCPRQCSVINFIFSITWYHPGWDVALICSIFICSSAPAPSLMIYDP